MTCEVENNRSKTKAARYAKVYNKMLKMIQEGLYPEGSKLPSEPVLAEQMEVSRSTLRQSLALLQEDGIIEAKRGIGNFVRKTININATGLEKMDNPIYKSSQDLFDHVRIEIIPGISTEYTERMFKRKTPVVLAVHRYYEVKGVTKAYCFSHIASDYEYLNSFNLNDEEELKNFMENKIYEYAHSKMCEIRVVETTENLKERNIDNKTKLFQMIRESIVDANGTIIVLNKFYVPIDKAIIKVYGYN